MKVVTETHFVRKNQILDTAEDFFFKKGFAKTTIVDIINKIDIANGTFYHYFKSKDELLMSIINRELEETEKGLAEIVDNPELSAIDKFNNIYDRSVKIRIKNRERTKMLLRVLYLNEDNIIFLHKKHKEYIRRVTPIFTKLLKQGNAEGTFDIVSPQFTAELILNIGGQIDEAFAHFLEAEPPQTSDKEILIEKYQAYSLAVHRLLGISDGSLRIINMKSIEIFFGDAQN
ncbi:TetR/AcrR family transcriptional regulator [Bacteroidota bacterium]